MEIEDDAAILRIEDPEAQAIAQAWKLMRTGQVKLSVYNTGEWRPMARRRKRPWHSKKERWELACAAAESLGLRAEDTPAHLPLWCQPVLEEYWRGCKNNPQFQLVVLVTRSLDAFFDLTIEERRLLCEIALGTSSQKNKATVCPPGYQDLGKSRIRRLY